MKLIIDIPDRIIDGAKTNPNFYPTYDFEIIWKAIRNGIPHETVTEFTDRCRECGRERVLDKIRAEILEEKECAYADFDKYKVDYLRVDSRYVEDELPYDDFRYGMERCIEILDKYRNEVSK